MFGTAANNPNRGPFGIQDQQTSSNQQGVPVAYAAGTRKIATTWFSPVYNIRSALAPNTGKKGGGGKGSKGGGGDPSSYDYYGTVAGGLCIGPVDGITSILSNGNEIWPIGNAWAVSVGWTIGELAVYDAQTYVCTANHTSDTTNAPPNPAYWSLYYFARGTNPYDDITVVANLGYKSAVTMGVIRIYWGTPAQTVEPLLTASGNDWGHDHPNYQGMCYVVLVDFLLGQGTQTAPNIEVVVRRTPQQTVITGSPAALTDGVANLAAVAMEVLTDQNMLGQSTALIDATTWQTAANYLDSQTTLMGASPLMDNQLTIRDFFDRMREMTDNFVRFDATAQVIETGVYQHGNAPAGGSYVTLTSDSLTERPKLTGGAWADVRSRSVVRFTDRVLSYTDNSVKADDMRAFTVIKEHRTDNLDRPWITRLAQAQAHAAESLRTTGRPIIKAEVVVRREIARSIVAGAYVLLDVDLEPGVSSIYQFFRVDSRSIPPTGPMTLQMTAENTLTPIAWSNAVTARLPRQTTVEAISSLRIIEGSYGLTGENGAIVILAQRPDTITSGFHLYFDTDTGGTFSAALGGQTNFACLATLTANAAAGDTTLAVSVADQPESEFATWQPGALNAAADQLLAVLVSVVPSGGLAGQVAEDGNGYAVIEYCSMSASSLTSANHYTLTVLRGRLNSTPVAWTTAHTEVWIVPKGSLVPFAFGEFATLRYNRAGGLTPDHGFFRLTPFTYLQELLLSSATSQYFHFPLRSPSAPNLTLTLPSALAVVLSSPTYPYALEVSGTWASADQDLVSFQILCEKSTDTAPRLIYEEVFTSAPSAAFDQLVYLETAGTYQITLLAFNATGLSTAVIINVAASGSGAKCQPPTVSYRGELLTANEYGSFGRLDAACQTPGAIIKWQSRYTLDKLGTTYSAWSATQNYPGAPAIHQPTFHLINIDITGATTSGNLSGSNSLSGSASLTVSGSTSGTLGISGNATGSLSVSGVAFPSGDTVSGTTSGSLAEGGNTTGSLTVGGTATGTVTASGTVTVTGSLTVTGQTPVPFPCTFLQFRFWASASGMTDSDYFTITFQDATYV